MTSFVSQICQVKSAFFESTPKFKKKSFSRDNTNQITGFKPKPFPKNPDFN